MKRLALIPVILLSFGALISCANKDSNFPALKAAETQNAAYEISLSDNSDFVNNQSLTISLFDGGIADAPMKPIAIHVIPLKNGVKTVEGNLSFKKDEFENLASPAIFVKLEKDGQLVALNKTRYIFDSNAKIQKIKIDRIQ